MMIWVLALLILGGLGGLFVYLKKSLEGLKKTEKPDEAAILGQKLEHLAQTVSNLSRDVGARLKEQRESVERQTMNVFNQVQGFTKGMTSLAESVKKVEDSVKNVSSFQEIFRAPKLRGIWGEMSLEASLAQYFPRELYKLQHYFKSGEAVDAVLKLPNDLILPIDSKFNWENFEKMVHAEHEGDRNAFQKEFFSDVKKKVDEIAFKYILPSEGTTDIALMYIPAETVYYELINNVKEADIPSYARKKNIVIVSPSTFASSVSAIRHWIKDIRLSKQTRVIIQRLERVIADASKLGDDFRKLGKHMRDAQNAYEGSEKRLGLMVERVQKVIEVPSAESQEPKRNILTS